ncbi:hypothetical protein [Cryobacterium melibiosiphilum]|uniref:hypothetical protein n=1 Tax=Cryobacterium melibiosiphilum TaxID=995039 RepID=UPI0013140B1E|nr:hypothetical protein [Cryobacterium melibiosiphilum]
MPYFFIVLGLLSIATNVLTYRGVLRPTSLNGLRRKKPHETDAAWTAGLRATLPYGLALAACLIGVGCLLFVVPEHLATAVPLGGAVLMVIAALLAVRALDRAVQRAMVAATDAPAA